MLNYLNRCHVELFFQEKVNSPSTEESNQICAHNSQGAIIEDIEVEQRILKMLGDLERALMPTSLSRFLLELN